MISTNTSCQLLCASESAYAISTTDKSGNYNPLNRLVNGKWVPDPTKKQYETQYNAVGFVGDPYVVVSEQINAALIGKTSTAVIVAYRGTLSPALNWDSFFDWLQDFWAEPESNLMLPGEVHSGFFNAQLQLSVGIKAAIDALDPSGTMPLYFTGHSKGGGMAPIGAMYIGNNFPNLTITNVVSFAGPNPGNAAFCNSFNSTFPNALRYQNYLDIVPLMPPNTEFIDLLEAIPDLPQDFIDALNKAKSWDYETAGTLEYIDANAVAKQYTTLEAEALLPLRMSEITEKIVTLDFTAIADAHHASCNYRYMKGTCQGTVCPT